MEVITLLIPLAIILALIFIGAFIWMAYIGQFDDLDTPALRMLLDEKDININADSNKEKK